MSSKSTPTDLVSEADLASERAIRELLAERRPEDGFLGEEGGARGGHERAELGRRSARRDRQLPVRDPAVVRERGGARRGGTLAGAVYDPNRDELFTRRPRGRAARLLSGPAGRVELTGRRARAAPWVGGARGLATAMVATGLAYDADVRAAQAQVLARLVPRVRDIRRFGSAALDLAWTAAGRYDAYFERTVKQWDIAAGALICERAGLRVLELPAHEDLPWGILVARRRSPSRCWSWSAGP